MNQLVDALRSQTNEEKERLRQEHQRLQGLHSALENERAELNSRAREERVAVQQRRDELEHEAQSISTARAIFEEERLRIIKKLDSDRAEFATYVKAQTRAAEAGFAQLKEEEERLHKIRDGLVTEKNDLEQRRFAAQRELQGADALRESLVASRSEIVRDRAALQDLAKELQSMSDMLAMKDSEVSTFIPFSNDAYDDDDGGGGVCVLLLAVCSSKASSGKRNSTGRWTCSTS